MEWEGLWVMEQEGLWVMKQGLAKIAAEEFPPVEQSAPLNTSQTFLYRNVEISTYNA